MVQEHEHDVNGGGIPDEEGEMEADEDMNLEDMNKRLKEMEEESDALREMQAMVEKEMAAVQVIDHACTRGEVQQHFWSCGTVNRVTILTDKFGQPKGFAYVGFVEVEAVQNALLLNELELHGRQLKVSSKRTNVPGMKQYRGRRPNPYVAFRP